MERADIVIAGGGPVGAALAAALDGAGLDVRLVDPAPRPDTRLRPVALSHGSRMILEALQAWGAFPATPIEHIHVSQAHGFGRTLMHADELGVPALGHVCNLPALADALAARVAAASGAARIDGRVVAWEPHGDRVAAVVDTAGAERELVAELLVLADGGRSAGADLAWRDYGQTAIAAVVSAERAVPHTAWERFTGEGPLALLPFDTSAGPQLALVWTLRTERAAALAGAPDDAFLAALAERFGGRVGRFVAVGEREAYPLALRFRRSAIVAPRVVAIGNAAQTLHPVAGQGLNLGLRDAFELAAAVRESRPDAIGEEAMLAAYDRARRADRMASISVTDGLVRAFGTDLPGAALARGIGLAALDLLPAARRVFARRMMLGVRGLP
jgi:2-octaprenyl-6-methoxyphenol hydroxylase